MSAGLGFTIRSPAVWWAGFSSLGGRVGCGHGGRGWVAVGKHGDQAAKTTGDGQVPKGTLIPPPPRDEGRHQRQDGGERDDHEQGCDDSDQGMR